MSIHANNHKVRQITCAIYSWHSLVGIIKSTTQQLNQWKHFPRKHSPRKLYNSMGNNYIHLFNGAALGHIDKDTDSNYDLNIFHSVLEKKNNNKFGIYQQIIYISGWYFICKYTSFLEREWGRGGGRNKNSNWYSGKRESTLNLILLQLTNNNNKIRTILIFTYFLI